MKRQRVTFGSCFLGKAKDFVMVSGGFGAGRRIIPDCEVFNAIDNFWTIFPSMNQARASHSIMLTDNLKYVYAFGGINEEKGGELDTIERLRINNVLEPHKDLNM